MSFSGDGKTVLCERGSFRTDPHLVLHTANRDRPIVPDANNVYVGRLSADASTLYAMCGRWGSQTVYSPFLQDLRTNRRTRAMSGVIPAKWHQGVEISGDGRVLTSIVGVGMYVLRPGSPPPEHPQIESIRQRYEGSNLYVTAKVSSEEPLRMVKLIPLKNGYTDPTAIVKEPYNAAFGIRWGGAMKAVKDRPGVYQMLIRWGDRYPLLDDSYTFRIIAVNQASNRTTFQDVEILR